MVQLRNPSKMSSFRFILVLLSTISSVRPSNVLILMPIATRSETHLVNPLAESLLQRSHMVTLVTSSPSHISHPNLTEIVPTKALDASDFLPESLSLSELRQGKDDPRIYMFIDMPYVSPRCHATYSNSMFKTAVLSTSKQFDLAITSVTFNECFFGLFYKLKIPFIQIATMPPSMLSTEAVGLRPPLSFVPLPFMPLLEEMSLKERFINSITQWSFAWQHYLYFYPEWTDIYRGYLGHDIPDIDKLRKNVSVLFTNTHFSINFPRPLMPDIVEVGGLHCRPGKPLNSDLEEFASKGPFAYFSLGTVYRDESLPDSLAKLFINVFSRLKINIIWKIAKPLTNVPKNVKVVKWLDQQDVLAHRNIKLFISHGGLLSTQEATYHGVPILGLPLYVDQDVNMKLVESHGYGKSLEVNELTEQIFESAILELLSNDSYTLNVKTFSDLFRDQPETPLGRAIYWIEYVIRHKGAPRLRSISRNLSYIQYHLYDVQLIILSIFIVLLLTAYKLISICRKCCATEGSTKYKAE